MSYITCLVCLQVAVRRFPVPAAAMERVNAKSIMLAAVELCHLSVMSLWGIFLTG